MSISTGSLTLPSSRLSRARRSAGERARLSPVLVAIAAAALLVPKEASFYLGSLRLSVVRAILLVSTPVALVRLVRQAGTSSYRFCPSDVLVPLTVAWMVLAVSVTEGPDRAAVSAGSIGLELLGSYLAGRMLLKRHGEAVALGRLIALLTAGTALSALPDPWTHGYTVHNAVEALTGYHVPYIYDVRNGRFRAAGVMEHPILLGTVCTFAILLSTQLYRGWRRAALIACQAAGALVAVSSAPVVGLALGLLCLLYGRLTPAWTPRWRWLAGAAVLGAGCFCLVMPNPLGSLIAHLTIDPGTGYYRMLEWQFAGQDLLGSPWFGLGLSDDWARPAWMPPSIDSLWLRSAMSFGIPGSCLIAACLVGACWRRVDVPWAALTPVERRLGTTISILLFLYLFQGFTVHFWGATWVLMGLFAGMRAHLGAMGSLHPRLARPRFAHLHGAAQPASVRFERA